MYILGKYNRIEQKVSVYKKQKLFTSRNYNILTIKIILIKNGLHGIEIFTEESSNNI